MVVVLTMALRGVARFALPTATLTETTAFCRTTLDPSDIGKHERQGLLESTDAKTLSYHLFHSRSFLTNFNERDA